MAKTIFYTAPFPCEVIRIEEIHTTAATDSAAVTLQVEKLTGTTAPGSGTTLLASTIDLKGTANTVVERKGLDLTGDTVLAPGNRLALKYSGSLAGLAGLSVTVYCKPWGRGSYRV